MEGDLASAIGPVPIMWSIEPPPSSPQPQAQPLQQQQQQFLSNGLGQRVMQDGDLRLLLLMGR